MNDQLPPGDGETENDVSAARISQSVCLIQRVYRGYRTRRELQGRHLCYTNRWIDTLREVQAQQCQSSPTLPARSPAAQAHRNWGHAVRVAKLARGDSNGRQASPKGIKPNPATISKAMDLQYFLEMMDLKHRHGSNLRKYHEYWKLTDSHENFFYWLDHGAGKDVELPACPRAKLEREQIRYLSREERLNYLVEVDKAGRLRWAKNNELVWTSNARYEDSTDGILPLSSPRPKTKRHSSATFPSHSRAQSISSSDLDETLDMDFKSESRVDAPLSRRRSIIKRLKDKLFDKDDWWIFVADPSYRLYIGIKSRGSFQHSSFLHGGRIAAAGMIKVRDGKLRDLAPLSGHYRPRSVNFHAFVHALQDQGADLSHVSVTKLYATLAGMEGYVGTKRSVIRAREKMERKVVSAGKEKGPLEVDL